MSDQPVTTTTTSTTTSFTLNPRQQGWLTALLIVATLAFGSLSSTTWANGSRSSAT